MLHVMRSEHARIQRAHGLTPNRVAEERSTLARREYDNVLAARRLNRAAGTLAASVLADSAVEHYRGSFKNKAMLTPIVVAGLTLAISLHGTADKRPVAHNARDTSYLLAAGTGLLGTGFHIYNVTKKVGGFSWQNLFYGAPLGAPMAILLSGLLGFCSERLRANGPRRRPRVLSLPAGKTVATVEEPKDVRIDLPIDANLPPEYIGSDRLRLEGYRRLAAASGRI